MLTDSPIDSIDHSWLFPRIDAACHHGGAGTTGASLRAGLPTIIKPFFGDQEFWAERCESLGVGSAIRNLTIEELTHALVQATQNERQVFKARAVGEDIRRVSRQDSSRERLTVIRNMASSVPSSVSIAILNTQNR